MRSPRTREMSFRNGSGAGAVNGGGGGGGGGGVTTFEEDVPDWLSTVSTNSSTVATTTSLSSRIAGLAIDLEDIARKEQELRTFPEEEEEEEVVEVAEEELLRVLDSQEDPFQVCSRLFLRRVSNPVHLKKMNVIQMEEFKQHGYLILDNFITKEAVFAIRQEALHLNRKECLMEASKMSNAKFQDTKARGDWIMWLHMGCPPLDKREFASLSVAFLELQSDLQEFMKLKNSSVEYQLSYYPSTGAMYKKHRDSLPEDGNESQQRRVTAVVYMNSDWRTELGGELRIWPPRKFHRVNLATHVEQRLRTSDHQNGLLSIDSGPNGSTATTTTTGVVQRPQQQTGANISRFLNQQSDRSRTGANISRFLNQQSDRSRTGWQEYPRTEAQSSAPGVSEADISISEPSECGSLRSDVLMDPLLGIPKSATSSVMADLGVTDGQFDVGSVDDMSVMSCFHEQTKNGVEWVEVGGEMVLDVAPLGGRCVLFLSGAVDHSVMPSNFERVAITSWFQ